jgi:ribonucleoside-diphosphate reductase alpha chain
VIRSAAAHFDTVAPFMGANDVTQPPMSMGTGGSNPAPKREYTAAEKTACSIEAMRNGGECEACQ